MKKSRDAARALRSASARASEKHAAVITGANTGIGYETAAALVRSNAFDVIVLACRDEGKGKKAVEKLRLSATANGTTVMTLALDLCSLKSVRACAEALDGLLGEEGIDCLINNAGVMAIGEYTKTEDGFETQVGTCHLGHYALTAGLMPALARAAKKRGEARVVTVSSEAHRFAVKGMNREDLFGEREYSPWGQYGQAKLANVLFAFELERRCAKAKNGVSSSVLHPGAVDTELGRYLQPPDAEVKWWQKALYDFIRVNFLKTPEQGAMTSVFLANEVAKGISNGKYYADCKEKTPAKPALSLEEAEWLWKRSAELTGVSFDI